MKNETKRTIITADGEEFPEIGISCIRNILSGLDDDDLKKIDSYDLVDRLAVNFVESNTKEDIDNLIVHRTCINLAEKIISEVVKRHAKKKETVEEEA